MPEQSLGIFDRIAPDTSKSQPAESLGIFDRLPSTQAKPKGRGASGSWDEPSQLRQGPRGLDQQVQTFQIEHPYLSAPVTGLARFGQGVVEGAKGTAELGRGLVKSYVGGAGPQLQFAKQTLYDPLAEHARGAKEAAKKGEAYIPPAARRIPETLGQLAFGAIAGGAIEEAATPGLASSAPLRSEIQSLAQISRSGIKSGAPQESAVATQPLFKHAVQESGFNPADISTTETAPQTDPFGTLYRGASEGHAKVIARKLGQRYDPKAPKPVPIMITDHMVDVAHRPMQSVIDAFRSEPVPEVQSAIVSSMRHLASNAEKVDPALARAYSNLADAVESSDGLAGTLDDFKVHANKETGRLFKLAPSGEVAASATPVWAYRTLADLVRKHLYPKLTRLQGPEGLNLAEYGRRESHAINVRDGIYAEWAKAAGDQAPAELQGYADYVLQGHSEAVHIALHPKSSSAIGAMSRALKGRPFPLADFNKLFQKGIGSLEGFVPEAPYRTGYKPPRFDITGQQQDLMPIGEVGREPLLAPPPGTSKGLGEEIFKVQQRAAAEARRAPPPTLRGEQPPIAEHATPSSGLGVGRTRSFYPGGQQPQQGQLFSIRQTPNRWAPKLRDTYSMADLHDMAREIEAYIRENPESHQRSELVRDSVNIRKEIMRRASRAKSKEQ